MNITLRHYAHCMQLIVAFSTLTAQCSNKKLVIGEASGLFSCYVAALNNMKWCDKNDVDPVIYWGPNCTYYEENGYNGSMNVWEYYFEPVSSAKYEPGDEVRKNNRAPDGSATDLLTSRLKRTSEGMTLHRRTVNKLINKYIKVKPSLQAKIDDFYQKNMVGKKTIAIHIRGTDKHIENKPVNPSFIFAEANKLAEKYPDCQFLVATDERAILEEAKQQLKRKVIYYDAYRSPNGNALHYNNPHYSKGKLGEEVVIEAYLLARCDIFLHTISAISSSVLFINPESHDLLFDYEKWYDGADKHSYV